MLESRDTLNEKIRENLVYACAIAAIHKNKPLWLTPFNYSLAPTTDFGVGLKTQNSILFDPISGLKIGIYSKDKDVIIAFGAYRSHRAQFLSNKSITEKARSKMLEATVGMNMIGSLLGTHPELFKKANSFVEALKKSEEFKGKNIKLTGQSLGGSLASYVSLHQRVSAIAFNSMPLGAGLQSSISAEKLQNADYVLTQFVIEGDFASHHPAPVVKMAAALNSLGFKTPNHFGSKIYVPTIYKDMFDTHHYIIGALLAQLCPDKLKICQNIASRDEALKKESVDKLILWLQLKYST
jgi:hypothetical protein